MLSLFILFILLVFIGKAIYDIHKISLDAKVMQLQNGNRSDIQEALKELYPLLIHNLGSRNKTLRNTTIQNLIQTNPGYIFKDQSKFISLQSFNEESIKQISVYKNPQLVKDMNLIDAYKEIVMPFQNTYTCNSAYFLDIFKGNQAISLCQNKHNLLLLFQIEGSSSLFLFHPKHKEDISQKENQQIKKWANKINLEPGVVVSIPPNWFYFYESKDLSLVGTIESDEYLTYLYNLLR
jgi:hypothetical protein